MSGSRPEPWKVGGPPERAYQVTALFALDAHPSLVLAVPRSDDGCVRVIPRGSTLRPTLPKRARVGQADGGQA